MHGWSGAALFAARLFGRTGAEEHLELAERAVERDLAVCGFSEDGALQVDEGWRLLPYLGGGSAGIGLVLAELSTHRENARHAELLPAVVRAAAPMFTAFPGLLQGRSGLIHFLIAAGGAGVDEMIKRMVDEHVRLLSLHAIRRPKGLSFPGHGLLRLSSDLATGGAGVLTALLAHRALDVQAGEAAALPVLPFLSSPRSGPSGIAPTATVGGR
jgi:hypothetical protein